MAGEISVRMPWGLPLPVGVTARMLEVAYEIRRNNRFYGNPEPVTTMGAHYGFKVEGNILHVFVNPSEESRRDLDMRIRILKDKISEKETQLPPAIRDFPESERELLIKKRDQAQAEIYELKRKMQGYELAERNIREPYSVPIDISPLLQDVPVALMPAFPQQERPKPSITPDTPSIEPVSDASDEIPSSTTVEWQPTSMSADEPASESTDSSPSEKPQEPSEKEGLPITVPTRTSVTRGGKGKTRRKKTKGT